jgi:hypothetical protein
LIAAGGAERITSFAALRAERLIGAGLRAFVQTSRSDASMIVATAVAESVRTSSQRLPVVARDVTAVAVLVAGRLAVRAVAQASLTAVAIAKRLQ